MTGIKYGAQYEYSRKLISMFQRAPVQTVTEVYDVWSVNAVGV